MTDLDTRAERLIAIGITVGEQLREAGPHAARATLAALDTSELFDLATLLCAAVDPDRARRLSGWPYVQPLHRDDWVESPRPLVAEWSGTPPRNVEPLVQERYFPEEKR